MNRPSLALCMIVKNEAHNIGGLLQSVRGCFDQIHITDTGSTDNTLEFIDKINQHIEEGQESWSGLPEIQVHHFDWVNDFAAARNYSFSHATTDYILWLDGDDLLSDNKAFIKWRDSVMHAGHYWVATYNYETDAKGVVVCKFIRERVIKRDHGFGWEFFVHEGIIQKEDKKFWPQRVSTWTVNHRRTEEDKKQDHHRNIKLFESQPEESLHPRMKFYYGKELFENGFPDRAGKPLMEAIMSGKLDMHDNLLAIQYAAQAAYSQKAYVQAAELLMNGLRIVISRAEFWVLLGDVYLTTGDIQKAMFSYKSALNCTPDDFGGILVIYGHAYEEYPKLQLAKISLQVGDLEKAKEYIDWLTLKGHPEAINLSNDYARIKDMSTLRTDLPKSDDVIITCPPGGVTHDWDENTLKTVGHGGSETAAIEVAKWIKRKSPKRRVKLFHQRAERAVMESGVEYLPIQDLEGYLKNVEPYAHIAWRHSSRLTNAKSIVWCHDLMLQGNNPKNYEKVMALSGFHKNYLIEASGVPEDKIVMGFNGIDPDNFKIKYEKDPLKVVFSSSPDRGLVQTIDIVKKAREISGLDIKLHTFYGFDNMRKMGHADWANSIEAKIKENDFVTMHGQVSKESLMQHFKEAAVWLYPSDFIESFCITAWEALAASTWPIVRDMGALPYTLKPAIDLDCCDVLSIEADTPARIALWANCLIEAIISKKWQKMNFNPEDFSWEKVGDRFMEVLDL